LTKKKKIKGTKNYLIESSFNFKTLFFYFYIYFPSNMLGIYNLWILCCFLFCFVFCVSFPATFHKNRWFRRNQILNQCFQSLMSKSNIWFLIQYLVAYWSKRFSPSPSAKSNLKTIFQLLLCSISGYFQLGIQQENHKSGKNISLWFEG